METKKQIRLGVLVPSSNTALEPLTSSLVASLNSPNLSISVHYSRFSVTQISLSKESNSQFTLSTIIDASRLLKDAKCDVIGWSGTSAGWLGFDTDETLCAAIQQELDTPATTSTLALNDLLRSLGAKDVGLVTPYTEDINKAIQRNYSEIGVEMKVPGIGSLGIRENDAIVKVDEATLEERVQDVAQNSGVKVVTTFCTNLRAAHMAAAWEERFDITMLDSVSTCIWGMLKIAALEPGTVKGWGKLFAVK